MEKQEQLSKTSKSGAGPRLYSKQSDELTTSKTDIKNQRLDIHQPEKSLKTKHMPTSFKRKNQLKKIYKVTEPEDEVIINRDEKDQTSDPRTNDFVKTSFFNIVKNYSNQRSTIFEIIHAFR